MPKIPVLDRPFDSFLTDNEPREDIENMKSVPEAVKDIPGSQETSRELSAVSIFSVNVMMLIIARTLQSAFGAMVFSTNNAILISTYHHSVQGKMLGYSVAATYIGLTAGPVIGGVLNANFGWKSIFAVSFLISAVAP